MYCKKCNKEKLIPSLIDDICIDCYEKENKINKKGNNISKRYIAKFCKLIIILITIVSVIYCIKSYYYCLEKYNLVIFLAVIFLAFFAYLSIGLIESIFNIESLLKEILRNKNNKI